MRRSSDPRPVGSTRRSASALAALAFGAFALSAALAGMGAFWIMRRPSLAPPPSGPGGVRAAPSSSRSAPAAGPVEFDRIAPPPPVEVRTIPGGRATLGSTADEARAAHDACVTESDDASCPLDVFEREVPLTTTSVAPFRLATHEVTNAELVAWLARRPSLHVEPGDGGVSWISDEGGRLAATSDAGATFAGLTFEGGKVALRAGFADRPAVWVSRRAVTQFCADAGMRLPSATEWEWAARGSARRRYPWGNAFFVCRRAVAARAAKLACSEEGAGPAIVLDSLQDRTPEGIDDLGGNVSEWVADAAPAAWLAEGKPCGHEGCFVVKGGDWGSLAWATRAAAMRVAPADLASDMLGWRCAADGA